MKLLNYFLVLPLFMFARDQVAIIELEGIGVTQIEAKALTQRLTSELIKLDEFMVLERSQMDKILKEQKFQHSGCVDNRCAVEIGKLLAVKFMIVGTISKVGKTFTADARLIKVETGESYESADYTHTGDIDYLLVEGMKAIAHKLSGIDYQVQEQLPVRETIQINNNKQITEGSGV